MELMSHPLSNTTTNPPTSSVHIPLGPDGRPIKKNLKEMSKQERRAYQEAQRQAKKQQQTNNPAKQSGVQEPTTNPNRNTISSTTTTTTTTNVPTRPPSATGIHDPVTTHPSQPSSFTKPIALFSHLPIAWHERDKHIAHNKHHYTLHPSIIQLGLMLANGTLTDANLRTQTMLVAFKDLILDYSTPQDSVLSRHLTQTLGQHISYLTDIRPLWTGMGSAIRQLKHDISVLSPDMPDMDAKTHLLERIDLFIQERITMALEGIADHASSKIKHGDTILTYANSSAVQHVLLTAHQLGTRFRVIVIDSRPSLLGSDLAQVLVNHNVPTTYALITGLGYAIRECTKVMLGANGMLSNGGLLAQIGSAQVAMMAAHNNKPVIVACETYKFTLAIHLDSIVFNELGDPGDLGRIDGMSMCKGLNLMFDVTPPEFLTLVMTELGPIPAESVPVVLREYKPLLESV